MSLDVAIIDYKISNMFSVLSACRHWGLHAALTSDKDQILQARSVILPGVGAFGLAMEHLHDMNLIATINEFISSGKPFMGICLGMQLLMSQSEEFGVHEGLNIIPGKVIKFKVHNGQVMKVPHIGWNKVYKANGDTNWPVSPLEGIDSGAFMYFIHSFYVLPDDRRVVSLQTSYGGQEFCSSLMHKNIFACQFHPEKSGKVGLQIFGNFARSIKNERFSQPVP